jgi:putative endonuclease
VSRASPPPPPRRPPRPDRRRALGRRGEGLAASHLERLGFEVICRNARTSAGEIDIIAFDGRTLVFVEVKTRRCSGGASSSLEAPVPLEGLRALQRARVRRAAVAWLSERGRRRPDARTLRFDAIGVLLDRRGTLVRLEHLEDAW